MAHLLRNQWHGQTEIPKGKGSTIIASQLPVNKWYDYKDQQTLADAIMDRLTAKSSKIELKGKSLRQN